MWVLSRVGFFSIVHKEEDPGELTIRARVRADLEELRARHLPAMSDIIESEGSDYRYRAFASKEAVAEAMAEMAVDIDYRNFKNEISRTSDSYRVNLYSMVWSVLYRLQEP